MESIFVNLKRFDVPRRLGGICPSDSPDEWIAEVMQKVVESGLCGRNNLQIGFLLPESLIIPARVQIEKNSLDSRSNLSVGCQGVFRDDIEVGGNFGAFTTNLPAKAAVTLGATWAIIGHSEERADKLGIITAYDSSVEESDSNREKALETVNGIVNREMNCAFNAGLNVLFCIGETAAEKGEGSFEEQKPRIEKALKRQVQTGLQKASDFLSERQLVIGYEPIWAIGPGRTPPDGEYIAFVSSYIKDEVSRSFGFTPEVVYGGGLKEENAGEISGVSSLDGGLIALTKFTQPIGFSVPEFVKIVEKYLSFRE